MAGKIKIAVVFGSSSPEHEVSLASARNVLQALDRDKFVVKPFGILKDGRWVEGEDALLYLVKEANQKLLPVGMEDLLRNSHPNNPNNIAISSNKVPPEGLQDVDIAFPVLHGNIGEDGSIQGLFEMLDLPYVGCGVFASAACMDKIACKQILAQNEIPQARWIEVLDKAIDSNLSNCIEAKLGGFPVFIKPANAGSSVGITKVKSANDLKPAIEFAQQYDSRVIIEEAIVGREIELGVLGYQNLEVSSVASEIIPKREFYDYEAKYHDNSTEIVLPAKISENVLLRLQNICEKAFKALDCSGLARIDFFYNDKTDKIYLNEINTLPGFTKISQYPRLMTAGGKSYVALLEELINLAFERHKVRSSRTF